MHKLFRKMDNADHVTIITIMIVIKRSVCQEIVMKDHLSPEMVNALSVLLITLSLLTKEIVNFVIVVQERSVKKMENVKHVQILKSLLHLEIKLDNVLELNVKTVFFRLMDHVSYVKLVRV